MSHKQLQYFLDREDTLTEMILFWNRRKSLKLADSLCKKYKRVSYILFNNSYLFFKRSFFKIIKLSMSTKLNFQVKNTEIKFANNLKENAWIWAKNKTRLILDGFLKL